MITILLQTCQRWVTQSWTAGRETNSWLWGRSQGEGGSWDGGKVFLQTEAKVSDWSIEGRWRNNAGTSSFFSSCQSFFLPASFSFPWPVDNSVGVKLPSVDWGGAIGSHPTSSPPFLPPFLPLITLSPSHYPRRNILLLFPPNGSLPLQSDSQWEKEKKEQTEPIDGQDANTLIC